MTLEILLSHIQSTGIFLIVLSILIIVHEWGHFITAKKIGVNVESFSIGFGPVLWSKVVNGTDFRISLVPLGGYVKMAGDERSAWKGQPNEFYSKAPGLRALVALNGPMVNFLLAYVCFVLVFMIGFPDFSTKVGKLMDGYPAAVAGIQEGDYILSVNGDKVSNWTEVKKEITEGKSEQLNMLVKRNNQEQIITITPKIEAMTNVFGQKKNMRLVGIVPSEEVISLKYGFFESLNRAFFKIGEIIVVTYKSLYYMITGSMSPKNMAGPVMIFKIIKDAAAMGFNHLVFIMGVISASLAIFNLLPIIPLDGGHLLLMGIEKLRGKPLPEKVENIVGQIGLYFILALALFVFYSDFSNLGWIDKLKSFFIK